MKPIKVDELRAFVLQVLERCGVSKADAETTADVLVTTDTWGIHTHGTKSLYAYTRRLRAKGLKPDGRPKVQSEGPAWAVVDGDSSLGMVSGVFAMKLAMAKAKTAGIALVVVNNSCHFGAAGYYASLAAAEGQMGIAVSNDVPSVAAPGSMAPVLGSNPFAFAAPSGHEGPMILDIATAEVAGGKVAAAAAKGEKTPKTWLIDSTGQPTDDPNLFVQQKAYLSPMSGHKGYGLGLMIEILSGVLSGSAVRDRVGLWMHDPKSVHTNHGHAFIAINPGVFMGAEAFMDRQDSLFSGIRKVAAVPAVGKLKIPGEIEQDKRQKALVEGIVFPQEVVRLLGVAAEENGCPTPAFLASG
jgi:ureidoglycolate dehydrogenase (NAD+)